MHDRFIMRWHWQTHDALMFVTPYNNNNCLKRLYTKKKIVAMRMCLSLLLANGERSVTPVGEMKNGTFPMCPGCLYKPVADLFKGHPFFVI